MDTTYAPVNVNPESNADETDEDGLKPVDVDEMIRTGQLGRVEL